MKRGSVFTLTFPSTVRDTVKRGNVFTVTFPSTVRDIVKRGDDFTLTFPSTVRDTVKRGDVFTLTFPSTVRDIVKRGDVFTLTFPSTVRDTVKKGNVFMEAHFGDDTDSGALDVSSFSSLEFQSLPVTSLQATWQLKHTHTHTHWFRVSSLNSPSFSLLWDSYIHGSSSFLGRPLYSVYTGYEYWYSN